MDAEKLRSDFPILAARKGTVYFDSACTTLKPRAVLDAERGYYEGMGGCAGRSAHSLARMTEEAFESAREKVARFVGAKREQLVWTKNCTEALNLVVRSLDYSLRGKIVTTGLEHHSLLLPIMEMERAGTVKMELAKTGAQGEIAEGQIEEKIDRSTALVAVHHTANTTGMRAPLKRIVKAAHDAGALVLVDAAQGVPHSRVDFSGLGADFLAFSGHKMLGPTGIGCLVGRQVALEGLKNFIVGGETVETVALEGAKYKIAPKRFEAGIQNYAGAIGLGAACEYLSKIGMDDVEVHERRMAEKLVEAINSVQGSTIYGHPSPEKRCALASFNLRGVPHHRVALLCDSLSKIELRSGVFCAQMAMEALGAKQGAVRASLYVYNTGKEIETFGETLQKIAKLGA